LDNANGGNSAEKIAETAEGAVSVFSCRKEAYTRLSHTRKREIKREIDSLSPLLLLSCGRIALKTDFAHIFTAFKRKRPEGQRESVFA